MVAKVRSRLCGPQSITEILKKWLGVWVVGGMGLWVIVMGQINLTKRTLHVVTTTCGPLGLFTTSRTQCWWDHWRAIAIIEIHWLKHSAWLGLRPINWRVRRPVSTLTHSANLCSGVFLTPVETGSTHSPTIVVITEGSFTWDLSSDRDHRYWFTQANRRCSWKEEKIVTTFFPFHTFWGATYILGLHTLPTFLSWCTLWTSRSWLGGKG